MIKNTHISQITNGDNSPITENIEINNYKNELEKVSLKKEYL